MNMTNENLVELADVIRDKEIRVEKIKSLTNVFHETVVCFKLNIPGPIKDNSEYRKVFKKSLDVFKSKVSNILFSQVSYLKTGPVAYLVIKDRAEYIKQIAIEIEESAEIGRIYDFDVYHQSKSISRQDLGKEVRRCILCDENVWICSRSRKHGVDELLVKIRSLTGAYIKEDYNENIKGSIRGFSNNFISIINVNNRMYK
ncbi:MAG: citrate lyase holo-[acyl-carrier protein] synthase [Acidaminobacteraceae bacterium]